jgi:peptidoglycan hydrolase-like protein with peptidoglycan-binding domain
MLNGVQAAYGLGSTLAVDNSFGPATESQVRKFQSWVYITSDGIVGRNTWNMLCFEAGQVGFAYASSSAAERTAWQAAYDAGCYVEQPSSGSPGYVTISKY